MYVCKNVCSSKKGIGTYIISRVTKVGNTTTACKFYKIIMFHIKLAQAEGNHDRICCQFFWWG